MANNLYPNLDYRTPLFSSNNQLLKVNGIEGARAYPTYPNSVIALFDANEDYMYIKTTDSGNYPTIDTYKFTKILPETPQELTNNFVTKEEFQKFKEEILNAQQSVSKSGAVAGTDLKF